MHVNLGGYHIRDIEFSCAFDVDAEKVGKDLSEAIFSGQNNTYQVFRGAAPGVQVERGMTHDGLGKYLSSGHHQGSRPDGGRGQILKETEDRRRRQLSPGRQRRSDKVVRRADPSSRMRVRELHSRLHRPRGVLAGPLRAGRFADRGRRHQVAGRRTIVHRVLTNLFKDRGVRLERTSQLNVGGNTDFLNMLERERLESKKISKTNAVTSQLDYDIGKENVHIGPSDYVDWLTTASGRTSGSRDGRSATFRSTWS